MTAGGDDLVDGPTPADITSPVTATSVTAAAATKALSALKLNGLGTLESVVIVPGDRVIVHTRNVDASTTTKELPIK